MFLKIPEQRRHRTDMFPQCVSRFSDVSSTTPEHEKRTHGVAAGPGTFVSHMHGVLSIPEV